MANQMITGNATSDGRAIYMVSETDWSDELPRGKVLSDSDETQAMLAKANASQATVCDPYPIEVICEGDSVRAASLRESIRANGPTVAVPGSGG